MVKHVVCFKFKDEYRGDIKSAVELLKTMKGKVPTALSVDAHEDELGSERSMDIMLEVTVTDYIALAESQREPNHVSVIKKYMHQRTAFSVSADFTIV